MLDDLGWHLYEHLRVARDAYLQEHPMNGKEILMGLNALLGDAALRLTENATEVQCDEMRLWLLKAVIGMPIGQGEDDAERG